MFSFAYLHQEHKEQIEKAEEEERLQREKEENERKENKAEEVKDKETKAEDIEPMQNDIHDNLGTVDQPPQVKLACPFHLIVLI